MSINPPVPTPPTTESRLTQAIVLVIGTVVTILGSYGLHLSSGVVASVDTLVVAAIGFIEGLIIHGQHKVAAAQAAKQ